MIDIKNTIFQTIKDKINKMRFLGENNPKKLKTLLYLIVLDDIYDWGSYLGEEQLILDKLKDLRNGLVLCNPDFKIQRIIDDGYYSTNTPQTSASYLRLWDQANTIIVKDPIIPGEHSEDPTPFTPDNTCEIKSVFFGGVYDEYKATKYGWPDIKLSSLTTCEKMDMYINRDTGVAYYIDNTTGKWKPITSNVGTVYWDNIQEKPKIYSGIEHKIYSGHGDIIVNGESQSAEPGSLTVTLLEKDQPSSDVAIVETSDLDEIL